MDLSDRKKKILCMAVEEYIKDCSPITSGGIKDVTSLALGEREPLVPVLLTPGVVPKADL